MRVEIYKSLPEEAAKIRQKVFIEEQGFENEYDDIDLTATHLVVFDDLDTAIATCRVFEGEKEHTHILGRLAVTKESRGKNIGSFIVGKAEEHVKEIGGEQLLLHAQCRSTAFYERLGYIEFGDVEEEEGCPHIWMRKML